MIAIGCPCSNREDTLPSYLYSISQLDYDKKDIHLMFLINNSNDNSYSILKTFQERYSNEYSQIDVWDIEVGDYQDDQFGTRDYNHIANIRNIWLELLSFDDNYVFSIDSDVLVPPNSLNKLLENNKDICSILVQNDNLMGYNILNWNGKRYYKIVPHEFDGLMPVKITGAAYLIKRHVLDKVQYGFHKQGEDIYFCEQASLHGFEIFCDTDIKTEHLRLKKCIVS